MADSAILIGWSEAKTGREAMAGALFGETVQYYSSLVKNGTIESFEPVLLVRHGGDFNGFILIRGDAAKLDTLQRSEEFVKFTLQAVLCLDGFGVIRGYIGDSLQRVMQQWTAMLPK